MFGKFHPKRKIVYALGFVALMLSFQVVRAQADDDNDPGKLFEKGQDAHAKSDYRHAIELYDAALKLKPEFPEAEFQRAVALLATNRSKEAIEGFTRAVTLRPDWAQAYSVFGSQLSLTTAADAEAERILRRALELNGKDLLAMTRLAILRERHRDLPEALSLMRTASSLPDATPETWRYRANLEHDFGDVRGGVSSIARAIELDPNGILNRIVRARFLLELKDTAGALVDLNAAKVDAGTKVGIVAEVAQLYARAGKPDEGVRLLDGLSETDRKWPEVIALRATIASDGGSTVEELAALEDLLKRNPDDAALLARLGAAYRRIDPIKSQAYYALAAQKDPRNPKYATGYAAALIQARKFAEAEPILKRVVAATPDDFTAHANLALALYEMKRFAEAIPEYEWLATAKPEIAATYFFIATAHDNLGEYTQALDAYEKFLAHADPANNKLEIEKVNLRLPPLRVQIQRGQGVKQKRP
jgi:tetratricopeptide (TPR) repeat protein